MKSVGQILREAREAKGLTVAQAVEGTRSKSQIIKALEEDDFSRFPAPIYTRGFIKIYAEYLGLNAPELISLYQAGHAEADKKQRAPSVLKPGPSHPGTPAAAAPELDLSPPPAPPASAPPAPSQPVLPLMPPEAPPAVSSPKQEPPELELPFDRAPRPAPPAAVVEPPRVAPVLPEAPKQPVSAPLSPAAPEAPAPEAFPMRRKMVPAKPAPRKGVSDEFSLEVREGGVTGAARDRAASLISSAARLPWNRILPRVAGVLGALLLVWLLFNVVHGIVARREARTAAPVVRTPPTPRVLPEPPPLYFPEKAK
jgi:transcriptional regulator with XRE-family HTH domain